MIRLEALSKRFSQGRPTLQEVDLHIGKGAWVQITGGPGSGKTTLLHLMMGLDQPTQGRVLLQHQHLARLSSQARARLRCNIGLIFQEPPLLRRRTLLDNVAFPLELTGHFGPSLKHRAREILERIGLSARISALPEQLSSAERQLACIARALVTRPSLILADEPLARLDSQSASLVTDLLRTLYRDGGLTIVQTQQEAPMVRPEPTTALFLLRDGHLLPQPSLGD